MYIVVLCPPCRQVSQLAVLHSLPWNLITGSLVASHMLQLCKRYPLMHSDAHFTVQDSRAQKAFNVQFAPQVQLSHTYTQLNSYLMDHIPNSMVLKLNVHVHIKPQRRLVMLRLWAQESPYISLLLLPARTDYRRDRTACSTVLLTGHSCFGGGHSCFAWEHSCFAWVHSCFAWGHSCFAWGHSSCIMSTPSLPVMYR